MAESPAHRFGQIIGDVLEAAIGPVLAEFAKKHGLYLDRKGPRPCRRGLKCTWKDLNGNLHDLDFVLERGGAPQKKGTPVAFVETAWRRYTKHSRNRAQEIQGAIVPLAETYRSAGPFKGAVLAGVFTDGALTQLRSLGFTVLYFPYVTVVDVFRKSGIDAFSDEDTPDAEFQKKVDAYERLSARKRANLARKLLAANGTGLKEFVASLEAAATRQIRRILILPLHGEVCDVTTVDAALQFIQNYDGKGDGKPVVRYEIQVSYNNGNEIRGEFNEKTSAIEFLRTFQPVRIDSD